MHPLKPNRNSNGDPLEELAQLARLETAPKTDVTTDVLRQIRVQDTIVAQKPLLWLALGSTVAALVIAAIAIPTFMSLVDPLNTMYQTTTASLL